MELKWSEEDPRLVINKRATIVVLAINLNGGPIAAMAHVDTKSGWNVQTALEHRPLIGEEDEWPSGWKWIFAPDWAYPPRVR